MTDGNEPPLNGKIHALAAFRHNVGKGGLVVVFSGEWYGVGEQKAQKHV